MRRTLKTKWKVDRTHYEANEREQKLSGMKQKEHRRELKRSKRNWMEMVQQFHIVLLSTKVNILSASDKTRNKTHKKEQKQNEMEQKCSQWYWMKKKHKLRTVLPSINVTFFSLHLSLMFTISDNLYFSSPFRLKLRGERGRVHVKSMSKWRPMSRP